MRALRADKRLDGDLAARCILAFLGLRANGDGVTWPSAATIARDAGASRRTVFRVLELAERLGLVERMRRGGGRNSTPVYKLRVPVVACAVERVPELHPSPVRKGAAPARGGVPELHPISPSGSASSDLEVFPSLQPKGRATTPALDRFPMRHDWKPTANTVEGFKLAGLPAEHVDAFVRVAVAHFAADASIAKTDVQWNQAIARFVHRDWNDPIKRANVMRSIEPAAGESVPLARGPRPPRVYDDGPETLTAEARELLERRGLLDVLDGDGRGRRG